MVFWFKFCIFLPLQQKWSPLSFWLPTNDDREAHSHNQVMLVVHYAYQCLESSRNIIFPQLMTHSVKILVYRHRLIMAQFQKCSLLTTAIWQNFLNFTFIWVKITGNGNRFTWKPKKLCQIEVVTRACLLTCSGNITGDDFCDLTNFIFKIFFDFLFAFISVWRLNFEF